MPRGKIKATETVAETVAPVAETETPETVAAETPITENDVAAAIAATTPETETAPAIDYRALRVQAVSSFRAFNAAAISIPVKPVLIFKAYRPSLGVLKAGMRPSPRQAAALCVAVLASGQRFNVADDSAPVTFPRRFTLGDNAHALENGASADCVASGLATYDSDSEAFTVTSAQAKAIRGLLGKLAAPAFA